MLKITENQIINVLKGCKVEDKYINEHAKTLHDIITVYKFDSYDAFAMFLANCLHETQRLTKMVENLNYSADRLAQVWPRRFSTGKIINGLYEANELARECHRNPEKIANIVYANRLGNNAPGDGWKYRGRGCIMLTGRQNYETFGALLKMDYISEPDLVAEQPHCWLTAAEFWRLNKLNDVALKGLRSVRLAINGGLIGFDDVKALYTKILQYG